MGEQPIVLMVDDNRAEHDLVRIALDEARLAVDLQSAMNGVEGRTLIEAMRVGGPGYSLVLLDLNMPVMDGRALLRWMRSAPDPCPLPTIVLTSSPLPSDRSECLALGAKEVWIKPSRLDDYIALVGRLRDHLP